MSKGFADHGGPACMGCCIIPQDPRVLVRAQEKGRPLNCLMIQSMKRKDSLPFKVLSCFAGRKRHFSKGRLGSHLRASPPGPASSSRPASMEVRPLPPQPDSGGCSLGEARFSLSVLVEAAIAGCETVLTSWQ